jgi:hypothetical protein
MSKSIKERLWTALSEITDLLESGGDNHNAAMIRSALAKSDQEIDEFLISNELWGGMGSLADQAFRSDKARHGIFETLLIELGRLQIEVGKTNIRTEGWVSIFENWQKSGVCG